MSDMSENTAGALICIFGNPFVWFFVLFIALVGFGSCSDIKQTEAKEKTKQIAMQLEIARLNAGITNKVDIIN